MPLQPAAADETATSRRQIDEASIPFRHRFRGSDGGRSRGAEPEHSAEFDESAESEQHVGLSEQPEQLEQERDAHGLR